MKLVPKLIITILAILALSYIGICGYYYFAQEKLLFYPSHEIALLPSELKVSDVYFQNDDGGRLHGWWMETENATDTVLFFHGNAGDLSDRIFRLKIFAALGYNCLIFDYRGYGKSEGEIRHEEDLYQDARAAHAFLLRAKGIKDENILVWAKSIGTGIAVDLAAGKNLKALVLESPYTSIVDIARHYLPILPVSFLVRYPLDSHNKIRQVKAPLLIYHSEQDEVIPFEFGQALYEYANNPKDFVTLKGGHNNDILVSEDLYLSGFSRFAQEYLE